MSDPLHRPARPTALVVRPGFESDLRAELPAAASWSDAASTPGLVLAGPVCPGAPFVFERQRMPGAAFLSDSATKPVTDETLSLVTEALRAQRRPWVLHVFSTDPALQDRAIGFARTIERLVARNLPDLAALKTSDAPGPDDLVLQLCRVPAGLWFSTAPLAALSTPWVGGIPRMKDDPRAPSRSYLKLEEAFARMNEWPAAGQTAVDLGAAPGGWTLALAKRGCAVTAVDNGPLRLPAPERGWGRIQYIRANGITFEPRQPVDWLVADMLVAPGVALGLLRRWLAKRLMRRCVVNIKIPQENAFAAVDPVLRCFRTQGAGFKFEVRQLYHDRREVTVMGRRAG